MNNTKTETLIHSYLYPRLQKQKTQENHKIDKKCLYLDKLVAMLYILVSTYLALNVTAQL